MSFINIGLISLICFFCGCSTSDYHSAILYKNKPTTQEYERPMVTGVEQAFYNGNVIQVPRGRLAQFELSKIKVGWLAERDSLLNEFPTTRLLPAKTLWLVTQIQGFKPNDFLRTSSKRSFIASAVKQNQNSEGYVPLDTSETTFALQTAEFQYEVTFTIYSVDNYKLKQVLGFAVADNPGVIKIGFDALKQLGGSTYSFIADPLIRSAKHEFGEDFLFERVLLTAGAVTEFKGTIYIVGDNSVKLSDKIPNIGSFALADLSDVKSMQDLRTLERAYASAVPTNKKKVGIPFRDPSFREAYSATLSAINATVPEEVLRDKAANVIRFTLSANPDQNRQTAEQTQIILANQSLISVQSDLIANAVNNYITNKIDTGLSQLEDKRLLATNIISKLNKQDPKRLKAAADFVIDALKNPDSNFPPSGELITAAQVAYGLNTNNSSSGIAIIVSNTLNRAGIKYTPDDSPPRFEPPPLSTIVIGVNYSTNIFPIDIKMQLDKSVEKINPLIDKINEYKIQFAGLKDAASIQQVDDVIEKANKLRSEIQALTTSGDADTTFIFGSQLTSMFSNSTEKIVKDIKKSLAEIENFQKQIEKAAKPQDENSSGSKITIF